MRLWRSVVHLLAHEDGIRNSEGDPFQFTTDRFTFAPDDHDEILRRLLKLPFVGEIVPAAAGIDIALNVPGVSLLDTARCTVLCHVVVGAARLDVTGNSTRRADRSRTVIEECLGSLATFRMREEVNTQQLRADGAFDRFM